MHAETDLRTRTNPNAHMNLQRVDTQASSIVRDIPGTKSSLGIFAKGPRVASRELLPADCAAS